MAAFTLDRFGNAVPATIDFKSRPPYTLDENNNFIGTMPSGIIIAENKKIDEKHKSEQEMNEPRKSNLWLPSWNK